MIMAELGRYPLEIIINCKMIGFWLRLVTGNQNKLSFKIYQLMLNIPNFQSKWITHVQTILSNVGRPDIFQNLNNHHQGSTKYLLHTIKKH